MQVCASLFPGYSEKSVRLFGVGGFVWRFTLSRGGTDGVSRSWSWPLGSEVSPLVECPSAVLCSTQTGDLVLLQGEFVVVGDLFVDGDGLLRVDHDLLLGLDGDHLGVAVWLEEQDSRR